VSSRHNSTNGSVLVDYIYAGSALIAKVASSVTSYFISDRYAYATNDPIGLTDPLGLDPFLGNFGAPISAGEGCLAIVIEGHYEADFVKVTDDIYLVNFCRVGMGSNPQKLGQRLTNKLTGERLKKFLKWLNSDANSGCKAALATGSGALPGNYRTPARVSYR